MKKLLIVVDMQNDFIDAALGTKEAQAIVPNVVKKIQNWDGDIIATMDTHGEDYLNTREGKHLPVKHCIHGTEGWQINKDVADELLAMPEGPAIVTKGSFGSYQVAQMAKGYDYVELIGLCSDICVLSNTLLIKNMFPEMDVAVDASCCAGVTPESHEAALLSMKMCQVDVYDGRERELEIEDEPEK